MKNQLSLLLALLLSLPILKAQSPQFALVRPNGTTSIYTSLDLAYNAAIDGDFIYLPGGSYVLSNPITKSIHIYGAGIHSDSSAVTTRTVLGGPVLYNGADNGSISGCYFTGSIVVQGTIDGYSITNCFFSGGIDFDSVSSNFIIANNILGSYGGGCLYGGSWSIQVQGQDNLISNNYISAAVSSGGGNVYRNNIFPYCSMYQQYCSTLNCNNELFENNIIACIGTSVGNSIFNNNIGVQNGIFGNNNQGYNNFIINDPIDSLFINFQEGWDNGNLHLVLGSPYDDAGTDGTELGIYGGIFPTSEGWVPKNPHIYFKDVDQVTGPDGKLHIEVGVRTNN